MRVRVDPSVLGQTSGREYAVRFFFGGLITAAAGIIAKRFGAGIGGLFLAFPAIFPASATLIEKHERERKEKLGLHGSVRGRKAAGVDAAGSALGSIGLFVFALVVYRYLPTHRAWFVLCSAMLAWVTVSVLAWQIRKRM